MKAWTLDELILFVLLVGVLWFLLAGCATMEPETREAVDWLIMGVGVLPAWWP